ncbi:MAG: hypothetical protein LKI42_04250 [Bacteroidales bacterium]|jgi:hypothetical protein|nr:hypothetical protein [Bacteroidales bacterium]MCI1786212.1 hypothetical protein [Bacteroidales bacterium]
MKTKKFIEVELVKDVRNCRDCKWFWDGIRPYGRFPAYDWNEDCPEAVRDQKDSSGHTPVPLLKARACGMGQVSPGIMHGCRKAPVMTIGINPNMTAYFPSMQGSSWAYPDFSSDIRYAYYYRHHSVYQESMDISFIKKHIIKGTEVRAEKAGWLLGTSRCNSHRWMLLKVLYEGETQPREIEAAWSEERHFVVVVNAMPGPLPDSSPTFSAGDIIGGMVDRLKGENVQLFSNGSGYYQRFLQIFDKWKSISSILPADAPLCISEDVAQHDMIACASPGWSEKYDIPTEKITDNCVIKRAFLLSQLVQSRPKVIVVVGGSSLGMFARMMSPFFTNFDYSYKTVDSSGKETIHIRETYQLLKETTEREAFIDINIEGFHLHSRLIVTPHFSYPDNFKCHSRVSLLAWQAMEKDFPKDVDILKNDASQHRVKEDPASGIVAVAINGPDDPIRSQLSVSAWNVLMAYYYDPVRMVADVLEQELQSGRLSYDKSSGHLTRAEGGCTFCRNSEWAFTEPCAYGKKADMQNEKENVDKIVKAILSVNNI